MFVLVLNHRLRPCRVTHLFNLWSFFTENSIFALETKCNFCFTPSRLYRPSCWAFVLAPSPPWGPRRKWSLTPLSLMELEALFVFRAVCLWVMQRWPRSPSLTNSTTSYIPLLAPGQYTPWENTSADGGQPISNLAIHPSVEATPPPKMSSFTSVEAVYFTVFSSLL